MGRPKIGDPVLVRFPPDQLAAVDAMASDKEISRAEVVRQLVARGLRRGQARPNQ